jgi:uncharacterized membrane protein
LSPIDDPNDPRGLRFSLYGLGTALCFSVSPLFLRLGLRELDDPLVAVSVGMIGALLAYLLLLALGGQLSRITVQVNRTAFAFQLLAGVFIGIGTWLRYVATDMIPIAIVGTLGRVNIPVVLLLSPLLFTARKERVTGRLWIGAALIIAGAAVVTFYG